MISLDGDDEEEIISSLTDKLVYISDNNSENEPNNTYCQVMNSCQL